MEEVSNKVRNALSDELEGRKSDLEKAVNELVEAFDEIRRQLREYEEMNEASIALTKKLREELQELKNAIAIRIKINPDDLVSDYRKYNEVQHRKDNKK